MPDRGNTFLGVVLVCMIWLTVSYINWLLCPPLLLHFCPYVLIILSPLEGQP